MSAHERKSLLFLGEAAVLALAFARADHDASRAAVLASWRARVAAYDAWSATS